MIVTGALLNSWKGGKVETSREGGDELVESKNGVILKGKDGLNDTGFFANAE